MLFVTPSFRRSLLYSLLKCAFYTAADILKCAFDKAADILFAQMLPSAFLLNGAPAAVIFKKVYRFITAGAGEPDMRGRQRARSTISNVC